MLQPLTTHRPVPRPPWASSRGPMLDLLARIARDRSEEAFSRLFDFYGPRIRAYMLRQGADAATAEELVQETLLTVWRKAHLYSAEKGNPTTWIFTIARNLRIDRLRREVPWQELSDEQAAAIPAEDALPDEVASGTQRQQRVQNVLADLPDDQRQVVIMGFIDGLSHSEIAERLSLPLGTVKSRMRLAYAKVRNALEDLR